MMINNINPYQVLQNANHPGGSNSSSGEKKRDLNRVQDPPFFPIATYQRMDLIGAVRNIQQDIERASLSPELKQAFAGEKLPDDATDKQIANALDKILSFRDTLSREPAVSKNDIQPGSILKLEV
jgi:hypothetical protein